MGMGTSTNRDRIWCPGGEAERSRETVGRARSRPGAAQPAGTLSPQARR